MSMYDAMMVKKIAGKVASDMVQASRTPAGDEEEGHFLSLCDALEAALSDWDEEMLENVSKWLFDVGGKGQ